jgi:predicted alpha/beta superfamily hydrolase
MSLGEFVLAFVATGIGLGVSPSAIVAPPVTEPMKDPVAVQFDLPSKITGRTYRIFIYRPPSAPPKAGWPVIYLLDSKNNFGTAIAQVSLRASTGQTSALVVGVGYPNPDAAGVLRAFDLTPSKPLPDNSAIRNPALKSASFGGAALFHRFMIEELRPVIAAMAPVDSNNQSLIGYSFGGLFALGVLFEHPDAYRTVVASSPSIWWNDREVLRKEAGFVAAVRAGKVSSRLLITSNGWEQEPRRTIYQTTQRNAPLR